MKQVVVIGGGFAGLWAALSAVAEAETLHAAVSVTLVNNSPNLVLKPRLYLADPGAQQAPLADTLGPAGVKLVVGCVEAINSATRSIHVHTQRGELLNLHYDALVVALGSQLHTPEAPGLSDHAYSVADLESARRLERRIELGSGEPHGSAVVVGGSFTGLEVATELRTRLGERARIVLVDGHADAGANLGEGPRRAIADALATAEIVTRFGRRIELATPTGVRLSDGEWIDSTLVVYAGGLRAHPLAAKLGRPVDAQGRIAVDTALRVEGVPDVFAAGDVARAHADPHHVALMSCQHAMPMGRAAGRNAVRHLIGQSLEPYRQDAYVTCLDLGPAGALFSVGWDRRVLLTGSAGKAIKRVINEAIRPPAGDRISILDAARAREDGRLAERLLAFAPAQVRDMPSRGDAATPILPGT